MHVTCDVDIYFPDHDLYMYNTCTVIVGDTILMGLSAFSGTVWTLELHK